MDEWTLCEALGANMSRVITEHYETFIVSRAFGREFEGSRLTARIG